MNQRFTRNLIVLFALLGLGWSGYAQTITTGAIASPAVCAGASITIPFTTSGTFTTGNIFTAQLSDPNGSFPANPTTLGTLTNSPSTTANLSITGTIPAAATHASTYVVRVISDTPAKIGTNSTTLLTIGTEAPTTSSATFCQAAGTQNISATGANLKWYTASSGGTGTAGATYPVPTNATGTIIYYVTQTVNGCESARTPLAVTVNTGPAAPTVTSPLTYCQSAAPATLNATGTGLRWYDNNNNFIGTSASAPTAAGTYIYGISQTSGTCESPKATLSVTVKATPSAPGVTANPVCQGTTAQALTASGSNLKWYDASNAALANAPTPPTSTAGSTTFYVTQTSDNCESAKTTYTFTVTGLPGAPGVSPVSVCQDSPVQPLTASGSNLKWYDAAGTLLSGAPQPPTNTNGTTNYQVSQTVNNCEGSKATIAFTVRPAATAPAVTNYTYCKTAPPSSLTANGTNLRWYSGDGAFIGTSAPAPPATPNIYGFQVTQTNASSCESAKASFTVSVKDTPGAPSVTPESRCLGETPRQITGASGSNLKWYDTNNVLQAGAPTPPTNTAGSVSYLVSQTNNDNCEGPKATLTVTIYAIPAAPGISTPAPYCSGVQAASLQASGSNLKWYGTASSGGNASNGATVPATGASNVGATNYYVSQTVNGCESPRASIAVTVKETPSKPDVAAYPAVCQTISGATFSASPLVATARAGANLNWYGTSSTGGTATASVPTPQNTTAGTSIYYVSQTLNGCESLERSAITVQIKSTPGAPGVSAISFCNGGNNPGPSTLSASGEGLKWFDPSGNLLGSAPTPSNNAVGTFNYQVQSSRDGCDGPKSTLTVTINALPGAPGVSNLNYCQAQQDQPNQNIGPLTASGQNLRWYNTDGNSFQSSPIPPITTSGTLNYDVSQTVNNCEGPKSRLTVNINTTISPVVSKTLVVYCRSEVATPLEATTSGGAELRWIDPYGNVTKAAPTPITTNTTQAGGVLFSAYAVNPFTGCVSPRTPVRLIVNTVPTLSLRGSASVNLGVPATLRLNFTSVPPYSYTLSNGVTGIANDSTITVSVLPQQTTTYQVTSVSNVCGTGLPGNPATATITVRIPTVTTAALSTTAALCAGTSISVPFTTTGEFNTGNVFRVQLADTTTKTYTDISPGASSSPLNATIPATLKGGKYFVRVVATNPSILVAGTNSPTVLDVHPLPTATLTGSQDIYETYTAKLSVAFVGDAPWSFTYTDATQVINVSTSANPYIFEVKPAKTTTYTLQSISNSCGSGPVSGTATVQVLPLLGVEDNWLDSNTKAYPVPVSSVLTVEIGVPLIGEPARLQLTDLFGRPTLERTTRDQKTVIDLSNQPAGLYVLRVQVGDQTAVRKVLKQ